LGRCAWFAGTRKSARGQIKPEYQYLHDDGHLSVVTDALEQLVCQYIPNSCWNLVTFSVQEGNLIIHRQTDYRIYEWTRIKYERNLLEKQLASTEPLFSDPTESAV
jgi:hypothetical protein